MGVALLFVFARAANAQEVIAQLPQYSVIPPALQEVQTNQMAVFQSTDQLANPPPETQPFQWGPVTLRPYVLYQFLYGDGVLASPGQSGKTVVQQIAPGLLLGVGDHWSLNYTPSWTLYSNKLYGDNFGQSVTLAGGTTYADWVLGLSVSYYSSSETLVETGGQTRQETLSTPLTASYRFNRELTLDLAVNQYFSFPEDYVGYREWSTLDWLNYQFAPRFSVGIGAGGGYTDVNAGSDMTVEQIQARINWRATDKISVMLRGGMEARQFMGAAIGDMITPLVGAQIQYQPVESTRLSLIIDRIVAPSYYTNQVTETTSIAGYLTQRLLQRFYLRLGGGYNRAKYIAAASDLPTVRVDDYYSLSVRLSTSFLKRGTIAALYQYSDNLSTQPGYGYTSNQFGFEVGFRY